MVQAPSNIGYIIAEGDIHAYVDGELSPERRVLVEAHLAAHPEKRQRAEYYRQMNGAMRQLSGRFATPRRAHASARGTWFPGGVMRYAAGVALIAAVLAVLGWLNISSSRQPNAAGAAQVASAALPDADAAMKQPVMFRVGASQRAILGMSFRKAAVSGPEVASVDLDIPGFKRVAASAADRESALRSVPGADFIYRNDAGDSLDLHVVSRPAGAQRNNALSGQAFTFVLRHDGSLLYWEAGDFAYMLVGTFDRRRFVSVATGVMNAIREEPVKTVLAQPGSDNQASGQSPAATAVSETVHVAPPAQDAAKGASATQPAAPAPKLLDMPVTPAGCTGKADASQQAPCDASGA